MLRTNLATRPFYNERAVHAVLGLLAALLLVASVLNAREILAMTRRLSTLGSQAAADEGRALELRQRATRLRATIDQDALHKLQAAAEEANTIIDRRTFSWTELFNQLEATLPPDVMLTSVRPSIEKGQVTVMLGVVGRTVDDIGKFMESLEHTGEFSNVYTRDEELLDNGTFRATLLGHYAQRVPDQPAAGPTPPASARGGD